MQQVRLWEVTPSGKLQSISSNEIHLEEQLEDWLADDITVLDENLLVIGRQVKTTYGGVIDLLCLDGNGDTVIVELKKGKTPREVAAQTLDYASWISGLSPAEITDIAEGYLGSADGLKLAFDQRLERKFPEELNVNHQSLIVAESIDPTTERIVRYLSDVGVRINVATVQHFKDDAGRTILARVFLIDPAEAEDKPQPSRKRSTLKDIQQMAHDNGVGALFDRVRNGVKGSLSPEPYDNRVWYKLRRKEGGFRTVLIIPAIPHEKGGLGFGVHATRLKEYCRVGLDQLKAWVPATSEETEGVRGWAGSSADERESAVGLSGYFQSQEEVDKFVSALSNAISQSRTT